MTSAAALRALGVPGEADELLLPWLQRLRNVRVGLNWGAGTHCCAELLPMMPTREQWRRMLRLPSWGPLRSSHMLDAFVDRDVASQFFGRHATALWPLANGTAAATSARGEDEASGAVRMIGPYRHFAEWFKVAHEIHQQFHVAAGPCTALCSTAPACHSNNCEFLLPLHAGYDLLLRAWMRRFGRVAPCLQVDAASDFDVDECLPYVSPLATVRSLCTGSETDEEHTYEGEREFV